MTSASSRGTPLFRVVMRPAWCFCRRPVGVAVGRDHPLWAARVVPAPIIEHFDIGCDSLRSLSAGLVVDPVDELHLQCAVGRFRKGVIVAAAGAAHGAFHAQPIQHESIFFGPELGQMA